jgi:hypothetical protein
LKFFLKITHKKDEQKYIVQKDNHPINIFESIPQNN